uniref:Putative secreted protein n=1 Tax=Anopheles darlingi TaxID=43151 RepID=A0A2M4D3T5_ANODA
MVWLLVVYVFGSCGSGANRSAANKAEAATIASRDAKRRADPISARCQDFAYRISGGGWFKPWRSIGQVKPTDDGWQMTVRKCRHVGRWMHNEHRLCWLTSAAGGSAATATSIRGVMMKGLSSCLAGVSFCHFSLDGRRIKIGPADVSQPSRTPPYSPPPPLPCVCANTFGN